MPDQVPVVNVGGAAAVGAHALIPNWNQPFYRIWEQDPLTGKPEQDVVQWFEKFEYMAELVADATDAIRLVELKKSVQGRALSFMQAAAGNEKDTYAHAKAYMLGCLSQPHQVAVYRQSFFVRVKSRDETVLDYLRDLRKLVKLAFPRELEASQNLALKQRFVEGLRTTDTGNPNFKLYKVAFLNMGDTLDAMITAVCAAEANQRMFSLTSSAVVQNATAQDVQMGLQALTGQGQSYRGNGYRGRGRGGRGGRGSSSQPSSGADGQNPSNPGVRCEFDGHPNHTTSRCHGVTRARQRLQNNNNAGCHHCGRMGHVRSTCNDYLLAKERLGNREPIRPNQASDRGNKSEGNQGRGGSGNRARRGRGGNQGNPGQGHQSTQNAAIGEEGQGEALAAGDYGMIPIQEYAFSLFEPYVEYDFDLIQASAIAPPPAQPPVGNPLPLVAQNQAFAMAAVDPVLNINALPGAPDPQQPLVVDTPPTLPPQQPQQGVSDVIAGAVAPNSDQGSNEDQLMPPPPAPLVTGQLVGNLSAPSPKSKGNESLGDTPPQITAPLGNSTPLLTPMPNSASGGTAAGTPDSGPSTSGVSSGSEGSQRPREQRIKKSRKNTSQEYEYQSPLRESLEDRINRELQ